ncbi:hypothetical protein CS0771_32810 [Catellatospora sp. IY07-71]|uniref:DUF4397 domain-containing protein n=1 Tax=Catellatospora sp. IY07-71 TaxID=2728827 RepID=UPI001BB3B348|nr:DUF4397 domain-containing protein [Catellatospora sp. IY07-71]BCJ73737.1 hypothetical protein CS0771_32810 [Catellatospora sp. IY07-71]
MLNKVVRRTLALTALTLLAASPGLPAAAADAATSAVYVVHGIPATPVDVYVNGKATLRDFQPGTVAGPLDLPAGSYDIDLTKPGDPVTSAIVSVQDAAVPGGANLSVVAHLDDAGAPKITAFVNDVSAVPAGKARLIVRHTAAAPAVDIRAGGTAVISGLANPDEAEIEVDAGTISADVVLAGTSTVAIPATDLTLAEGSVTVVYAIGSAEAKSLALVTQVIEGAYSAPSGVEAGEAPLPAPSAAGGWAVVAAAGLLLLIVGGRKLTRLNK